MAAAAVAADALAGTGVTVTQAQATPTGCRVDRAVTDHSSGGPAGAANRCCNMWALDNRTTRAQKFTWNADGTPNFGNPVRLGVTLTSPSGEPS